MRFDLFIHLPEVFKIKMHPARGAILYCIMDLITPYP